MAHKALAPLAVLILGGSFLGCSGLADSQASSTPAKPAAEGRGGAALAALFDSSDQRQLALDPLGALARGEQAHAEQFGDYISHEYIAAMAAKASLDLQRLETIDRQDLTAENKISYDVFRYQAEAELSKFKSGAAEMLRQLPFDQLFGYHVSFPEMSSGQSMLPFNTLADFEHGLQRLDGFVTYLKRAQQAMLEGIASGHTQPEFVTLKVIAQLDVAIARGVDGSTFLQPSQNFPEQISAADRQRLVDAYQAAIASKVLPAYQRLRRFLQQRYLPASRRGVPGLASMTDGDKLYRSWPTNWVN